jgi:hypothetical protein
MRAQRANYLEILGKKEIVIDDLLKLSVDRQKFETGLKNYETANPVHANQTKAAANTLKNHFEQGKPTRPLNSLILGPAGSGKSYLAKQFKAATGSEYREFNLSQCESPGHIKECFDQIGDLLIKNEEAKVIAFFDEFDVRIGGISAVQFLIQPMSDGKDSKNRDLSRAAFIFSGSYLKDRHIFDSISASGEGIDLIGFLYDAFLHSRPEQNCQDIFRDLLDATTKYYPIRRQNLPTTNALEYVRSLEKINDFISRINGFVVTLPDLGSPLNATRDRFSVELERLEIQQANPDRSVALQLIELVDGLRNEQDPKRFLDYPDPYQPILEFKNLILLDRLSRVISMLLDRYCGYPKKKGLSVQIRRSLLGFLATVPLLHGMRSLKTLTDTVKKHPDETVTTFELNSEDLLRRHIADYHEYATPERMWLLLQAKNPNHFKKEPSETDGDGTIVIRSLDVDKI